MPVSYVLGYVMGWEGVGVWLGLVIGLACASIALMYRYWAVMVPKLADDAGTDAVSVS